MGLKYSALFLKLFSGRFKIDAQTVDAVAQSSGGRAVVKDVTKMPTAVCTEDFRADHSMALIEFFDYSAIGNSLIEGWPSAVAVKF